MTPKRILMLFTIMNRGGAETMVMNYYRHIDRTKLQFDFLVHRKERGDYDDEIEELGGKIYRLSPISLKNLFKYKQEVKVFFDKYGHLYNGVHGHCSELGYWIYKEAAKRGFSFIAAHAHNANVPWDKKYAFRAILKRFMLPCLTHYFSCSYEASLWLFGKEKASQSIILPNAIASKSFTFDVKKRNVIREKLCWTGKYVIGNVGRFNPQKNHKRLIEIFSDYLKKNPNSILALIGDKSYLYPEIRKKVKDLGIENNVHFLGARSDVNLLMQGMDVFCFPSLYEGFGVALLEAQAAGLHSVISNTIPDTAIAIPHLVTTCSLSATNNEWVKRLHISYKREQTHDKIISAGFDIESNALWLQNFYLEIL